MARSASALHNSVEAVNDENAQIYNNSIANSSPKSMSTESHTPRRAAPSTPKTPLAASSPLTSSPDRRTRRTWSEAEEACLISGVAKVRVLMGGGFLTFPFSTELISGMKFYKTQIILLIIGQL